MNLTAAVGFHGTNHPPDVRLVQLFFNLSRPRFPDVTPHPLVVDGLVGSKTVKAIERFQREVMGVEDPHPILVGGDATARALVEEVDDSFSEEKLAGIMAFADAPLVRRYFRPLEETMQRYEINTSLRRTHFLAQLAHESGSLRFSEELASGEAYEGREDLGNTQRGDGRRFKGRGLIQLTGRANYQRYSDAVGIDYIADPDRLADEPQVAADVSGWFWSAHDLNHHADRGDITTVTRIINGGYNGLEDRLNALRRAACLFGL